MVESGRSAAPVRRCARQKVWHRLGLFAALGLAAACHTASASPVVVGAPTRCPAGTFDYGDGMVACALPEATTQALRDAHAAALKAAGPHR